MEIYEVYIDVYFIENVLFDAVLITFVLLLLHERIVPWKVVLSSLAGGIGAVGILMSGVKYSISYVIMVLFLDGVMILINIFERKKSEIQFYRLAMGIIYFQGMAFTYGKLMECVARLGGGSIIRMITSGAAVGVAVFIIIYNKIKSRKCIYQVILKENDENIIEIKALFDTGNLLTEPISGKPVSIIEETDVLRNWMIKYPQKYKVIPYHSIGNEHGLLEGIMVDELIIQKEKEQVVNKNTIIAFYKGKLSRDEAFQMILNHSLM